MAVLDLAARTAGAQGIARQAEIGMTVGAPRAGPAALGPWKGGWPATAGCSTPTFSAAR